MLNKILVKQVNQRLKPKAPPWKNVKKAPILSFFFSAAVELDMKKK